MLLRSLALTVLLVSLVRGKSWSTTLNVRVAPGAKDCFFIANVGQEHELEVDFEVRNAEHA